MASFQEMFSAENVQKLMADPRIQLGMQMLAAGGPQQGNPGFGARLGQAGQGFMQDQQQAQLMRASQLQMQQHQAQAQQQAQLAQRLQDPEFQAQLSPSARQLAAAGASPEQIFRVHEMEQTIAQREAQLADMRQRREGTLAEQQRVNDARIAKMQQAPASSGGAQQPRQPAKRQVLEEPLPDGRIQKHIWDETTGNYRPYGSPYQAGGRSAQGGAPADPIDELLGGLPLPGGEPLQQQRPAPLPQGADLLMNRGQPQARQPTTTMIAGGAVKGQANQQGPARPTTDAEFDALPKGALYIDPDDGRTYRK